MAPAHCAPNDGRVLERDPIDVHIGSRVRLRRTRLAITREQLAGALNVTCEQVDRFEAGGQPVPVARLWDLAEMLDVPVQYFFEED